MNYYERHLGDIAKDCGHLTTWEYGAYSLLLDWYYANECGIPVDKVCAIARAYTPQQRRAVILLCDSLFEKKEGRYTHNKCEQVIAKYLEKSRKASSSARKRWEYERNANALQSDSVGNAIQTPVTSSVSTDVDTQGFHFKAIKALKTISFSKWSSLPEPVVMVQWLQVRRTKRATNSQIAMDSVGEQVNQAQVYGITADDCIRLAVAKSWSGFKLQWLLNELATDENHPITRQRLLDRLTDRSWAGPEYQSESGEAHDHL